MDGLSPEEIYPVFDEILELIDEAAILDDFRCMENSLYLLLFNWQLPEEPVRKLRMQTMLEGLKLEDPG